jgi:hypothetical protein
MDVQLSVISNLQHLIDSKLLKKVETLEPLRAMPTENPDFLR